MKTYVLLHGLIFFVNCTSKTMFQNEIQNLNYTFTANNK